MWVIAFHTIFLEEKAAMDLRGHVLDDAVDEVKALVVVGLGGDKLLKNSQQTGLREGTRRIKLLGEAGKTRLLPKPAVAYYFICSGAGNRCSPLLQEGLQEAHQRGDVPCPFPQDRLEQVGK